MFGCTCCQTADGAVVESVNLSEPEPNEAVYSPSAVATAEDTGRVQESTKVANGEVENGVLLFDDNGKDVSVKFTKTPLGMTFENQVPIIICKMVEGSHAEEIGVKIGYRLKAVNGKSVDGKDFPTLMNELVEMTKKLRSTGA
mmetsp:Transcript_39492/g.70038  ORF Transcript_39492/g.70038 Transcript_39492/m.70038 type:complete len:143 (+) Transcript_39492:74-502(+)